MEQKVEFRKVRDFGEIINDTFLFLKQMGKPLFKSVFTICGFLVVAQALISIVYQLKVKDNISAGAIGLSVRFGWEYLVMLIISLVSYSIFSLTTLAFIHIYREKGNEAPTPPEVWVFVKFYLFKFIWMTIVTGTLIMLGFIFCLIPGFYLMPILSLIYPIMVIEGTTFGSAFDRSFKLVKGHWWTTFGVQIIMFLIIYAGVIVVALPSMIISGASLFLKPETLPTSLTVFNAVFRVISYVLMILPTIGITFSYYSLSEQKDGIGLMDRVNNLGSKSDNNISLPTEEY